MGMLYYPEFLTATILHWQHLLSSDRCKEIFLESLDWLSREDRCKIYGFVIMPNHIHLIWRITDAYQRFEVQGALFSYTGHRFKKYVSAGSSSLLSNYLVCDADRKYQF